MILLNLVPSLVVIPISYGSPTFQENGIVIFADSNLKRCLEGSTPAGWILSFISACEITVSNCPVFLTCAIIKSCWNSIFSIVRFGSAIPAFRKTWLFGLKRKAIRLASMIKGIIP